MDIQFADKQLALIETNEATKTKLPPSIIVLARKRLRFIRAAADERDLRQWKSLHYKKLRGDRRGQYSIRLNKKWRLIVALEKAIFPPKIMVMAVEDYH